MINLNDLIAQNKEDNSNKLVDLGLAKELINDKVLTDVPANAVFTDTVYDDTTVKADIAKKQDKLTAGTNITISGTTISAKDTVYNDTAVKADIAKKADKTYVDTQDTKKQDKLSAVTDIVMVTELPAEPYPNVMYLIEIE